MREICLDTETTGLDPAAGHRVVEIACIELVNRVPSGRLLHRYVNPERDIPPEAFAVHGLSREFLSDKPLFADIADELAGFVDGAPIVAHNAEFDMRFVNAELARAGRPPFAVEIVDTVTIARGKFPGQQASLDALCKRFGIDNAHRTVHGARLDAELLAAVYLELMGGRQHGLGLAAAAGGATDLMRAGSSRPRERLRDAPARPPRPHAPSEPELAAHATFLAKLKNPIWTA